MDFYKQSAVISDIFRPWQTNTLHYYVLYVACSFALGTLKDSSQPADKNCPISQLFDEKPHYSVMGGLES